MPLSHIFHLSDLHIRNGDNNYSRYEEYSQVFKETIVSINNNILELKLSFDDFIIVITGDIFHNKNVIGNYGLFIYREFIQAISKIGRLYIISGNHDYDQSDINKPSLVYSSTFDIPNVFVLNNSMSFIIDDVGFSFVSIDKTLDKYRNSGRIQDLPEFPIITNHVKYKIALFHGSFASAKLYNGKSIEETFNPYPLEWVQDFDYVLLGDIHKRQVFNYKKKTICGYSGSLIQQNFGEDIIDHGYLIWSLKNKDIQEINVYNNIGYINIIEDLSYNIYIRTNGKYTEELEAYIKRNIEYFPKILEIKSFSNINYQSLSIILNKFNISFQIVSKLNNINNQNTIKSIHNEDEDTSNKFFLDTNYLLDYFKKLLSVDKYKILLQIIKNKETLLFDTKKYPEDLLSECIKRNRDLEPIIEACDDVNDVKPLKKSFLIKYLEWEGLLCYENKNWINFKDLDAKTFMIKGSNGTGKSAIYDILLLAIWATNNKFDTYSAGFINHNKDKGYTIVDIEIDNIIYRIKREFCKKKNSFKITNKSSVLSQFNTPTKLVILKKDAACNTEVKSLFGDINTFLSTSMITQSIDNDILLLNYKDTLATIDKSHNIQFIYHLYNMFKTAINKYKDFRKVIQNKKEVYEKLLFNCSNNVNDVNDSVILQLNEEVIILNNDKKKLLETFNAIDIDINKPLYQSIIDTDYSILINDIKIKYANSFVTKEEYLNLKEKLNYYKYNSNDNDINLKKLAKMYYQELEDEFNKLSIIHKPCDISFLHNEKKELDNYVYNSIEFNEEQLIKQKEDLHSNKKILADLVSNKPRKTSIKSSCRDIDYLNTKITKIYGNIKIFNDFIYSNNNIKQSVNDPQILKKIRASINIPINIKEYKKNILTKETLVDDVTNIKDMLATLDKVFQTLYSKQQQLATINIPRNIIEYKNFETSVSIAKELKHYNINIIDSQISEDEIIVNEYYKKLEDINILVNDIDNYNNELRILSTNDEYKYNPKCRICCNRPWVSRIKEISIIIETLTMKKNNIEYDENKFLIVKERYEKNNKAKENYHLLNEWYVYFKFKETNDKIATELNNVINSKNNLYEELITKELELKNITTYIEYFIIYSYMLFEEYNDVQLYDIYNAWENKYNETMLLIEELEKTIHYNEIIKPRITKYIDLKKQYHDWELYNNNKKIIDAYHYYKITEIIEINDLYNEYQSNEMLKPLIKKKIELNILIENKINDIKILNDKIVKYSTINSYNNENKNNYNSLLVIDSDLETIIDVLDTILINFQSFRKELYEKLILNKLVDKTNKIIKTLCHSNTKPFKLNYNVDISNDTVHINWLIHNDNISIENDKQYISVSQASGFQRFVISLALRMSLYFNNYDILCNQLYIDEGFINFDKNNLSIVPTFIKSLLQYFNTIIILSHIDIIQDSVDEKAEICFNNINGISSIFYN